MSHEIFGEHFLSAQMACFSQSFVMVQLFVLFEPGGRLKSALTKVTFKEFGHEAMGVGHVAVGVVLSFEGRRTIRTGELTFASMGGGHVFPQKSGLHEIFGTNLARVERPRLTFRMSRESVISKAALGEDFGMRRTVGTGKPRPLVGTFDVLLQVRGRFEHFGTLGTTMGPGFAMPVILMLGQLRPRSIAFVADVANEPSFRGWRGGWWRRREDACFLRGPWGSVEDIWKKKQQR